MEEEKRVRTIDEILNAFPKEQRFSLAILQQIQKEYNYISSANLRAVANYLLIPVSEVFSITTFFKALSLNKKGKFILKVCDGTACHIRGSVGLLDEIRRTLHIDDGETTEDGLFSLEVVNCVGSCAMAPVVICNEKYHGDVKIGGANQIIEEAKEAMANE